MIKPSKPPKLTEKHVQDAVTQFLELDGWRAIRTDPVSDRKRGKGFGEVGMPDYLFVRYPAVGSMATCWAHVMWIEFKRPGGKPKPHQMKWHAVERAMGAVVHVVDDIDLFREWYMASGLNRHMTQPLLKLQLGRKANAD